MHLHIPTLLLTLMLGFLMLCLQLTVAQRGLLGSPVLRLWTQGSWIVLVGFVALVSRLWLPDWLSIVAGNGGVMIGLAFYSRAIYRFVESRDPPWWYFVLLAASLVALVPMLALPLNQRTGTLSIFYGLLLAPGVGVIARNYRRADLSLRMAGATLALAGLCHGGRAVHAWTVPQEYQDLFQASLGQGLTFLVTFLGLLGAGFGFVLAGFERAAVRLEELATHDGLTGCINRTTADSLLEHAMLRGQREGAPVSLILLDLDHFKQVNDEFGHRAGDAVLRRFAEVVRSRLRGSDVFSRVGGEEFSVLLPGTDAPGARRVAEDIRRAVAAIHARTADGHDIRVTVSAGVATAQSDSGWPPDRLYARADQALYRAKALGRDRVESPEAVDAA